MKVYKLHDNEVEYIDASKFYKTTNGLTMYPTNIFNWQVQHTYANNTGPLFYSINVGGMAEMWNCIYKPEENIMSIANMAYSSDDVLHFKVLDIEQANVIVKCFADGMDCDMNGTIYLTSNN